MLPYSTHLSDAPRNLYLAIRFALLGQIKEVCVCFGNKLLRGNRCKKIDSEALDAFDSPNFSSLAEVGVNIELNNNLLLKTADEGKTATMYNKMESRIIVVHLVPGFDDTILKQIALSPSIKAIVLILYGSGNAPSVKENKVSAVKQAIHLGKIVVIASQCIRGSVNLNTYANGRRLLLEGALSGSDMTIETICTKLGVLLGNYNDINQVKTMFLTNLRGEVSSIKSLL